MNNSRQKTELDLIEEKYPNVSLSRVKERTHPRCESATYKIPPKAWVEEGDFVRIENPMGGADVVPYGHWDTITNLASWHNARVVALIGHWPHEFKILPLSKTTYRAWLRASYPTRTGELPAIVRAMQKVVAVPDANPWVFSADARQFWQFATKADVDALNSLTEAEFGVLLGWMAGEDDPEAFGYSWPTK